jgi:hypothetical protein
MPVILATQWQRSGGSQFKVISENNLQDPISKNKQTNKQKML